METILLAWNDDGGAPHGANRNYDTKNVLLAAAAAAMLVAFWRIYRHHSFHFYYAFSR